MRAVATLVGAVLLGCGGSPAPEGPLASVSREAPAAEPARAPGAPADVARSAPEALNLEGLPSPAPEGSYAPSLAMGGDGLAYLTWLEPVDGSPRLVYSSFLSGGWTVPVEVVRGVDFTPDGGEAPALAALADGTLLAHWVQRRPGPNPDATYVHFSVSRDRGLTWTRSRRLHDDRSAVKHGSVSVVPLDPLRFAAVWIDGRGRLDGGPGAGLFLRTVDAEGRLGEEVLLDERVCDGGGTTTATLPGVGPVVVYRDRSGGDVRDVALVRRDGRGWTAPRVLRHDGWRSPDCPRSAPGAAARERVVLAAWYTEGDGADGEGPRLVAVRSRDGGGTFRTVSGLAAEEPMGPVRAALLADGRGLLAWRERRGSSASWVACEVGLDGAAGDAVVLRPAQPGPLADGAALVSLGDEALFAWVGPGTGQVLVGRLAPR